MLIQVQIIIAGKIGHSPFLQIVIGEITPIFFRMFRFFGGYSGFFCKFYIYFRLEISLAVL